MLPDIPVKISVVESEAMKDADLSVVFGECDQTMASESKELEAGSV